MVRLLHEAGAPVAALCRRPAQVQDHERRGVRAVTGDLTDQASLERAMAGVQTLFLLTLADRQQAAYGRNAVTAAQRAGVERVVHLSTADANPASVVSCLSVRGEAVLCPVLAGVRSVDNDAR